jgi:hypothetical protein
MFLVAIILILNRLLAKQSKATPGKWEFFLVCKFKVTLSSTNSIYNCSPIIFMTRLLLPPHPSARLGYLFSLRLRPFSAIQVGSAWLSSCTSTSVVCSPIPLRVRNDEGQDVLQRSMTRCSDDVELNY